MLTLTPAELRELTGHRRSDAQARELEFMGVPYRARRDGSLAVLRSDLTGRPDAVPSPTAEPELQP